MAPLPLDPASPDVTAHHLLVLPADVTTDDVELLAVSRFPRAAWETAVPTPRQGRAPRGAAAPATALRLSRHTTLVGPYAVDRAAAADLGLPSAAGLAYVVRAPVERGERPWEHGGDRDGLRRAFPDGLPVRDEGRVVSWLIAAARRLGGAVRVAATRTGAPATLLVPEPAAAVDLTVWSDIWLEPEAALAVMRQALPRAELNLPEAHWSGPPTGTGSRAVLGAEDLDQDVRRDLHVLADQHDIAALTDPPPMHGYGALADLDVDGMIALEIAGEQTLPPVVAQLPWATEGAVAYRVRWEPPDLVDQEQERPPVEHRVARGRVAPLVQAVARAVHAAVGGEITDMMDFVVDPADL